MAKRKNPIMMMKGSKSDRPKSGVNKNNLANVQLQRQLSELFVKIDKSQIKFKKIRQRSLEKHRNLSPYDKSPLRHTDTANSSVAL